MIKKNTDNLQYELMQSPSLDEFLDSNQKYFTNTGAVELLNELFDRSDVTKADLARQSGMSTIYLYQILSGKRNPSRNRLITLCYGLKATLEETQQVLKLYGWGQLYPKFKRDSIIIYGLTRDVDLYTINDRLFAEDEETLF